jgi:serine/threonine protein kinase
MLSPPDGSAALALPASLPPPIHLWLSQVEILELLGRHAGITPLYAVTEDPSTSPPNKCLVMEFAHHGSLDNVLAQSHANVSPPTDSVLLKMAVQVADAMQHLALHDLVHGDLATRNVLVYKYSQHNTRDVEVKISDFGLASRVRQAGAAGGAAAGPSGPPVVSGTRPVRIQQRPTNSRATLESYLLIQAFLRCAGWRQRPSGPKVTSMKRQMCGHLVC